MKKNKNDIILKNINELNEEILFIDFKEYMNYFTFLCKIIPINENESIEISYEDLSLENIQKINEKKGLVYVMKIKEKIFKIGQTSVTFKERVSSYNCGKIKNREKGTCSTTNFFILQSILNLGFEVEVYSYFLPSFNIDIFGKSTESISSSPSKAAEKFLISEFEKKYNKKPIGCGQK